MSENADRKPYVAPAAPQVVSTLAMSASVYFVGSGADNALYSSTPV